MAYETMAAILLAACIAIVLAGKAMRGTRFARRLGIVASRFRRGLFRLIEDGNEREAPGLMRWWRKQNW